MFELLAMLPLSATLPDPSAGYWGPPTSTIDFCEPNHAVSHHVAEWWNTLSSIPIFLVGVSGVWLCRAQQLGPEQTLCYTMLGVMGLGTIAFHTTLMRTGQVMDEIPMLWGTLAVIYCGYQHRGDRRRRRGIGLVPTSCRLACVGCGLGLYALVATVGYFYAAFLAFILMFASPVVVLIFLATTTFLTEEPAVGPAPKRLLAAAAGTFAGGVVLLWSPSELLCHRLPIHMRAALPLHAFWHLASAAGSHLCLTAFALARFDGEGAVAPWPSRAFAGLPAIQRRELDHARRTARVAPSNDYLDTVHIEGGEEASSNGGPMPIARARRPSYSRLAAPSAVRPSSRPRSRRTTHDLAHGRAWFEVTVAVSSSSVPSHRGNALPRKE